MKKIILTLSLLTTIFTNFNIVSAEGSGACSYHGGVNCSKTDFNDGSVICNDGWRESKVMFEDVLKCDAKVSCPFYLNAFNYDLLKTSYQEYINKIKKDNTLSCSTERDTKIRYISQSEDVCRRYESSIKMSALSSGRSYTEQECNQLVERKNTDSSYQMCVDSINANTNIHWANMQLACMARESEKPLAPKTSNLKCEDGKVFLKDGTCGSAFAQFLANSLKSFNDNMSKVSTSSSTTTQTLTKTLIIGTKGDQVKILQNKLKVESTGYFGSLTRSAVIKFQKDNNITQTGTVGPATRQALNKL